MEQNVARQSEDGLEDIYLSTRDLMTDFYKNNKGFEEFTYVVEDIINYIKTTDFNLYDLSTSGFGYIHAVNVGIYCYKIGQLFNLSEEELYDLVLGGLLHDIGKHYIDPSILNKPGKLLRFEMIAVSSHEDIGANIIRLFTDNDNVIGIINYHHRFIKSLEVPIWLSDLREKTRLFPLICSIGDITDAILAKRVYKPSLNLKVARDDLFIKGIMDIDNIYDFIYR